MIFLERLIICMLWTPYDIQYTLRSPLVAICRTYFGLGLHGLTVEPRVRPFKSVLRAVEPRVSPFNSAFDLICPLRDYSDIGFVER